MLSLFAFTSFSNLSIDDCDVSIEAFGEIVVSWTLAMRVFCESLKSLLLYFDFPSSVMLKNDIAFYGPLGGRGC